MATLEFDRINKNIIVKTPDTEVTVQELVNAIRDFEDEPINLDLKTLATTTGKQDLGGGVFVGITLELINDWRVKFEDRAGPSYISCRVKNGNLIAKNAYGDNPINPSAYTQVTVESSTSSSILETGLSAVRIAILTNLLR